MSRPIDRNYVFKGTKGISFRRFTVTAAAGAATKLGRRVQITSEALTTAAAAVYTLTLTNAEVKTDSLVIAKVKLGTSTQGVPIVTSVAEGNGSVVIKVLNNHATDAFNGTIVIDVLVHQNSPA